MSALMAAFCCFIYLLCNNIMIIIGVISFGYVSEILLLYLSTLINNIIEVKDMKKGDFLLISRKYDDITEKLVGEVIEITDFNCKIRTSKYTLFMSTKSMNIVSPDGGVYKYCGVVSK